MKRQLRLTARSKIGDFRPRGEPEILENANKTRRLQGSMLVSARKENSRRSLAAIPGSEGR